MLRAEFEVEEEVIQRSITESKLLDEELLQDRGQMVRSREADAAAYRKGPSAPAARKRGMATSKKNAPRRGRATKTPRKPAAWKLRLYVAGQTPKSIRAFANLKVLCEEHLKGRYQIEVIDLLEHPDMARGDQIVADPDAGDQAAAAGPARSSATCPTPTGCWWAWPCSRWYR